MKNKNFTLLYKLTRPFTNNIYDDIYVEVNRILSRDSRLYGLVENRLKLTKGMSDYIETTSECSTCYYTIKHNDKKICILVGEIYEDIKSGFIENVSQIEYMLIKDIDFNYFEDNAISFIENTDSMHDIKTILKYYHKGKYRHLFNIDKSREQILEDINICRRYIYDC